MQSRTSFESPLRYAVGFLRSDLCLAELRSALSRFLSRPSLQNSGHADRERKFCSSSSLRVPSWFLTLGCVLALFLPARADLVDFAVTPVTVSGGENASFGSINITGGTFTLSGAEPGFTFSAGSDFDMGLYVWMAGDNALNVAKDENGFIAKFSASYLVDGTWTNWTSGFHNPPLLTSDSGPWLGGGTGYVGLRISNGPDYNYGVALVTFDANAISLTVSDFAFQSTVNSGVSGAAIPEPAATSLMAAAAMLGAAALWRRRSVRN